MFQQIYSIARNTFTESIRQPIYTVLIVLGLLILTLMPAIASYTMDDDNKLLVDMSLSWVFFVSLLLAAFTATGVLTNEIENKTVLTVISKPVSRTIFILGKYFGVCAAIAMAFGTMSALLLLTLRHRVMQTAADHFDGPVITFGLLALFTSVGIATLGNYFYRWVFTSTLTRCFAATFTAAFVLVLFVGNGGGRGWVIQHPSVEFAKEGPFENGQVFVGLLLLFFAIQIIIAVALASSTRLKQAMTLIVCFAVFALGLVNDFFIGNHRSESKIYEFVYGIIPNFQFLWPADYITQGFVFTPDFIYLTAIYTAGFVAGFLALAVGLFQTREVG